MNSLSEQYRPATLDQVAGHQSVKQRIAALAKRGLAGRSYWITGKSGQGKTTIARVLAGQLAKGFAVDEMDAQDLSIDRIRDIERTEYTSRAIGGSGWVFIVNEAHKLRGPIVSRLLTAIENAPEYVTWIFTTTVSGGVLFDKNVDALPFLSRCVKLELTDDKATRLALSERAQSIARENDLDGQPLVEYAKLLGSHSWNLRAALNDIESGAMLKPSNS